MIESVSFTESWYVSQLNDVQCIFTAGNNVDDSSQEGDPRVQREPSGPHGGGHSGIGGLANNPVISPYDPAFWLTHNQLERLYWIWQMLDLKNRQVRGHGAVAVCWSVIT
jgi:hypothetical protein